MMCLQKWETYMNIINFINLAAQVSLPTDKNDPRNFLIGAVGIREDGVIVSAKNGAVLSTDVDNYQYLPSSHAEGRALRKLGKNGILFVARLRKIDRELAMARPCNMCRVRIKSFNVKKVYYSIDPFHYGIWYPNSNIDKVFNIKESI